MANHEKDLSTDERLLRILEAQQQSAQAQMVIAEATAKTLKPKSLTVAQVAQASAFNPRGEKDHPMPRLKCEIFAPWKLDPNGHSLTREEVELCNLLEPGEYDFELNDGSPAKMRIEAIRNTVTGTLQELHLRPEPPWDRENHHRFKPLTTIFREILGDGATPVRSMRQEKALIASGQLAVSVSG